MGSFIILIDFLSVGCTHIKILRLMWYLHHSNISKIRMSNELQLTIAIGVIILLGSWAGGPEFINKAGVGIFIIWIVGIIAIKVFGEKK